jgi:hypothetical protein
MKSLLYCILWIIGGVAFFYSTVVLLLRVNLWSWNPEINLVNTLLALAIIASFVFIFWLAGRTAHISVLIVSLLVCILLSTYGTLCFINSHRSTFLGLFNNPAPEWFKITTLMIFISPLIIWIAYPLRAFRKEKKCKNKLLTSAQ